MPKPSLGMAKPSSSPSTGVITDVLYLKLIYAQITKHSFFLADDENPRLLPYLLVKLTDLPPPLLSQLGQYLNCAGCQSLY